ncbi:MAG: ATP-binding protein [Gammaproteobacteria bacterium]|jgi:signal transduction histidine kinase
MKPVRLSYPWLSTLGAMLVVLWQFALVHGGMFRFGDNSFEDLPAPIRDADNWPFAAAALLLLIGFDIWRYLRSRRRYRDQIAQFREQLNELFDSRRELGTRARTYSDHADKLKMFISERLLETIEYDEKFLHFKNIASEVRHNGVISYDKAQTALKKAESNCQNADEKQQFHEATVGLLYLWDLLDLSTTDNIALHVANQIYDCEEHYFQAMLDHDTGPAPFQPTFMISHALGRALLPITEKPEELGLTRDWPKRGAYADDKFSIQLRNDSEMLGNENHMVLLIENLLNNALFYSQQKEHRNRFARVSISLGQREGDVELKVYNRGPRIKDDEKDKIYQLGFSSRRIREHHGKGLGLYFVNEIVKGFEGSIEFDNVDNREGLFVISVKLANGEIEKHQLQIVKVNGRPMCQFNEAPPEKRHEWAYDSPIVSIEASQSNNRKPQLISGLKAGEDSTHLDGTNTMLPRWVLEVRNRKRTSRLVFTPLDVRGVEFTVRLPSAKSRLDNED